MPGLARQNDTAAAQASRTILVVDRDRLVAEVLCDMLAALGYRGLACSSAGRALALCENGQVDGALVEEGFETKDGRNLIASLRERQPEMAVGLLHAGPAGHQPGELVGLRAEVVKPTSLDGLHLAARLLTAERHLIAV